MEEAKDGLEKEAGKDYDADDRMSLTNLHIVSYIWPLVVCGYPPFLCRLQYRRLGRKQQCKADMQSSGRQHGPRRVQ
jgi:hypothetical protein